MDDIKIALGSFRVLGTSINAPVENSVKVDYVLIKIFNFDTYHDHATCLRNNSEKPKYLERYVRFICH